MTDLFIKILNMSISACWLILVVLVLRFALKKAPKWVRVLLWGIVAVRLLFPFSIESSVSLVPQSVGSGELVSEWMDDFAGDVSIIHDNSIYYDVAVAAGREPISSGEGGSYVVTKSDRLGEPSTVENTVMPVLAIVWLVGVVLFVLYTVISYLLLRKKVATAIRIRDNLYQSENVASPFVLGIFSPRIYLPFRISEQSLAHVIAHEQAHIRRKDHWWKPLGFLLLTVHWFNPLMWLAYVLLCRDIELACDEKVIKGLGTVERADYSAALLSCSVSRHMIAACPIAFGEVSVKTRVKSVLSYKKPASWVILIALILCVVVAVCFLTNPIGSSGEPDLSFLNYENAISLVADREDVRVIYYPPVAGQTESFIKIGSVSGDDLAFYLDNCQWHEVNAPMDSLSSPGSIEFVIEDDYRITVYDRKDWSFRQYAKVAYHGDIRYYITGSSDYDTAVELAYSQSDHSESETDGQYHLMIGAEGVRKIQITTPSGTETQRNTLGLPFANGQEVHLKALDGVTDLRGVSITALGAGGEIIYAFSVPEGATNEEIINAVGADGWLLAPTVAIGAEEDGQYYHIISAEGVAELKLSGKNFGGGCVHADGSLFKNGERVWLQQLDGVTNVEDVTVTALDKDGNVLYGFLLVPNASARYTMNATILEIHDGYYLVEPVEDSWELNSANRIEVPMKNMDPSPEPEVGDVLQIEYDGQLMETYPAQISQVYSISVLVDHSTIFPTKQWHDGIAFVDLGPNEEQTSDFEISLVNDINTVQYSITWARTGLTLEYGLRSSDGIEYYSSQEGGQDNGQFEKIPAGTYRFFVRNTDYTGVPAYENPTVFPDVSFEATGVINFRIP